MSSKTKPLLLAKKSGINGKGCFAAVPLPARKKIGELAGKKINNREAARRVAKGGKVRICQVDEFKFEVIPEGHMLSMVNRDQPGVIGRVGTLLGTNAVNISQFELSRNMPGGKAMSIIRVDSPVPKPVVDQLRAISNMVSVRLIEV